MVAFGQAVAHRLFSTKTYIAMPEIIAKEDLDRLEALCMLFGVGLVLFALNRNRPHGPTYPRAGARADMAG